MKTTTVKQLKEENNLKAMIEADKKERESAVIKIIEEASKKYNCTIEPRITVTPSGNIPSLAVIAK